MSLLRALDEHPLPTPEQHIHIRIVEARNANKFTHIKFGYMKIHISSLVYNILCPVAALGRSNQLTNIFSHTHTHPHISTYRAGPAKETSCDSLEIELHTRVHCMCLLLGDLGLAAFYERRTFLVCPRFEL